MVKVRLKRGAWEVEITCREDRVRQVVESVLAGMGSSMGGDAKEGAGIISKPIPTIGGITGSREAVAVGEGRVMMGTGTIGKGSTCKGLIEKLWHEGWFVSERNLGEVHEELARLGYNYDRTAVSHALTDLVREGILSRIGSARTYRYVQKRPPMG
ncbi:MAG: hypothetical protein QW450_00640 [Candidatus Nitrosocaldus sp.]